jgi:hypothetical protein
MRNESRVVIAVALLFFTAVGAIGLTVKAQAAGVLADDSADQLIGGSCGTVSPDGRDECCARQNDGKPQVRCVGYWDYMEKTGECRYVCGFKPE